MTNKKNTRKTMRSALRNPAGRELHHDDAPEYVLVGATPLGYKDVAVRVRNKLIVDTIEKMLADKVNAKACFVGAWASTRNIDVPKAYAEQGDVWDKFCDDIVLFMCARFALFGSLVPISLDT